MKKTVTKKVQQILIIRKKELLSKTNKDLDIDMDGDETDEIQAKIIANIASQINAREKEQLVKIEKALLKIKDGTYGLCEECEEVIGEKRLLAYPESNLCIGCAENIDRENRLPKGFR